MLIMAHQLTNIIAALFTSSPLDVPTHKKKSKEEFMITIEKVRGNGKAPRCYVVVRELS